MSSTAHPQDVEGGVGAASTGWPGQTYYTPEHMETVMRRAAASGISPGKMMFLLIWFYGCMTSRSIHPLEGGYLRRKVRTDRRPGLPIENPLRLLPRNSPRPVGKHVCARPAGLALGAVRRAIKRDPLARAYRDRR